MTKEPSAESFGPGLFSIMRAGHQPKIIGAFAGNAGANGRRLDRMNKRNRNSGQRKGSYISYRAEMKGRDGIWRGYFGSPPRDILASEATGSAELLQRCIDERWDKEGRFQWRIFECHTSWKESLWKGGSK
jgi:hypothetical protein